MTVLQQSHIHGSIRIFKLLQVLLDDPAILLWQAVNMYCSARLSMFTITTHLFFQCRVFGIAVERDEFSFLCDLIQVCNKVLALPGWQHRVDHIPIPFPR